MDLTERKKAILSAIIKSYITSGEPIGSKALCSMLGMNVSPATLRNEMNSLCEMGYLEQPHTSAGRVPTDMGYKVYVSDLMEQKTVSNGMKQTIDTLLQRASRDPENLLALAGQILADITGLPAIVIKSIKQERYVRRVEFLPMGKRSIMIVLITSDGIARSRLCHCSEPLSDDMLADFDKLTASKIIGTELSRFDRVFLQTLAAELGVYALPLSSLLTTVFEMVMDINSSSVSLRGESNLLSCCETEEQAKGLLEAMSRKTQIISMLDSVDPSEKVVFGGETGIKELQPSNMVVSQFSLGEGDAVKIGVIGPKRIDYERIIPDIEYFAEKLSKLVTETLIEMED